MCWFTLTPVRDKKHKRHSSDSSCAEDLVRVHKSRSRLSDIKVKIPSSVKMDIHHQRQRNHLHHHQHPHLHPRLHHHQIPHLHPLHLHPTHGPRHHHHLREAPGAKLRGPGRKRSSPSAPPSSQDTSACPPRSEAPSTTLPASCEPVYRTQIVEPATVRQTTRVALRGMQSECRQSRLRRVAGYEVLGRELPWKWDCVSSTERSAITDGDKWSKRKGHGGLKYPPFDGMESWM